MQVNVVTPELCPLSPPINSWRGNAQKGFARGLLSVMEALLMAPEEAEGVLAACCRCTPPGIGQLVVRYLSQCSSPANVQPMHLQYDLCKHESPPNNSCSRVKLHASLPSTSSIHLTPRWIVTSRLCAEV
eukprot:scaffold106241_cov20-Tisochrysis_lutea.AAC.5